ncbi:MAG: hypothetical protein IJ275_06115 [Ruminococcus sp.]|nr:hypothetical protein [Ruminococcus sp.]
MRKAKLDKVIDSHKDKTKSILERIKSNMNQGQFKKLMKDDEIRAFFALYGVEGGESDG